MELFRRAMSLTFYPFAGSLAIIIVASIHMIGHGWAWDDGAIIAIGVGIAVSMLWNARRKTPKA